MEAKSLYTLLPQMASKKSLFSERPMAFDSIPYGDTAAARASYFVGSGVGAGVGGGVGLGEGGS